MKSIKTLFLIAISIITFSSCIQKNEYYPTENRVNKFIWGGLNAFYKWQKNVPDLNDDRFQSEHQLNTYLNDFDDPERFFYSLMYKYGEVDKFSWIVDDYVSLENAFKGRRATSGIKFSLIAYKNDAEKIYAVITDVIKGSDAERQGIKRGDIFNIVDGQQLTRKNYYQLLVKSDFYEITLSSGLSDGDAIDGSTSYQLVKEDLSIDPIQISKVIEHSGKKVGYLLYNQFASNYDQELNATFQDFKNQQVDELIVDLRYNGGGSIQSAIYLASMITGQFKGKVFCTEEWNEKVMKNIDNNRFINKFTEELGDEPIQSLYLTKVYFIVSNKTASASELMINGLKPYIDVKLVGTKTVGKQVGSITLYDSEDYTKSGNNLNTDHRYAMQPIVLEIKNSKGENNPNGYVPEVSLAENAENLGELGEVSEPLLARTLQYMETGARSAPFSRQKSQKEIWNSDMTNPDYQRMYVNK